MITIQTSHAAIKLVADGVAGELVDASTDQVPERMTTENVSGDKQYIYRQHYGSQANAEAIIEPERFPHIPNQEPPDEIGETQKLTMQVL